jgi:hypothetical protein
MHMLMNWKERNKLMNFPWQIVSKSAKKLTCADFFGVEVDLKI